MDAALLREVSKSAVELIEDRFDFASVRAVPTYTDTMHFFLDFCPLNLGQTMRFCAKLRGKLADPRLAVDIESKDNGEKPLHYAIPRRHRCENNGNTNVPTVLFRHIAFLCLSRWVCPRSSGGSPSNTLAASWMLSKMRPQMTVVWIQPNQTQTA